MGDLSREFALQTVSIVGTDSSGNQTNPVGSDANLNLKVIDFATAATGSAVPTNASYMAGKNQSGNLVGLNLDASGNLFALPLPTGASTSANQSTEITSLQLIDNPVGSVGAGTAGTNSFLVGGIYNSTLPVLTTGQQAAIQTDANGRLLVSSSPLPTTASQFSFGDILTAATTLVPVERTTYTQVTTNAAMTLVSSSANDTSAGTGARTVQVTYLDATMAGPFVTSFTMNGTTAVTASVSNMAYIEKIQVLTVGSGGSNAGTLTLKSGATTVGTINAGDLQTFWAHHYVPTGKTTYISGFSINSTSTTTGSGGTFIIKSATPTVANTPEIQVSDFHRLYGQQSSTNTRTYLSPIQVAGPARIRVYVAPETTTSTTYRASFDYIDN